MRRLLSIISSFILLTAVSALPVSAAGGDNQSMTVSTEISPTYLVSIPTHVTVLYNEEKTSVGEIMLTEARLELHKGVKVSMVSDNLLKLRDDQTITLAYTITEEAEDTSSDKEFTSATYLKAGEKTDLMIGITKAEWEKAYAGVYSNTVTFQIEYTDLSE
mgnify:CR=1 FL=1